MNTNARANFLPDERFVALRPALQEHLGKIAPGITVSNFASLCDGLIFTFLHDSFRQVGASEGSIWLLDPEKQHLIVAHNNGPDAGKIIGFRQPISEGIVSMVVATEQAFAENEVYKNKKHSPTLDRTLGKTTYAMIVVPFYLLGEVRGVISCVQLLNVRYDGQGAVPTEGIPAGFAPEHMAVIHRTATIVTDLLDHRLLKAAIGWGRQ
ncbi:MAG TPA: GAF domain-containing protein [Chthoniobacterales bacterium]|nr:GAF domain-containing protein [Chthoniobacterales bacterium]